MHLLHMLLCLVLIVIATLAYQKLALIREAFTNIAYTDTELSVCPATLTAKRENNIIFCNDKKGLPACALIADDRTRDGIPACHVIINEYLEKQAAEFCPPSMRYYFEDPVAGTSGCTASLLVKNKTAPADPSAPKCAVYQNDQNITDVNSCFNQKELETTALFGTNAVKHLIPIGGNPSAYLTVMQYTPPGRSAPNACAPDKHAKVVVDYMQRHADKSQNATEKSILQAVDALIPTGKFLLSCEAQRKVYVDHTLQQSDLIPHLG